MNILIKRTVPLALMLVTGCGNLTEAPPEPVLIEAGHYMVRSFDDPGLREFIQRAGGPVPGVQWDFKSLYWAGVYFNPVLEEAKALVGVAKGAETTAGQRRNPVVSFSPSFDTSATPDVWLLGLGLSIPIETNGKREIRQQAASEQTISTQYQLAGKAWDIRSQILNSIADLQIAQEAIRRNQALLNTQQAIVAEYDKRTSQGQMPTAPGSQAHVNYQQTLLQLEQAKTDLMQADVRLAGAVGVPVAAVRSIRVTPALPVAESAKPISREEILGLHPAILTALADYRAAHQLLQLEVAKQIPDFDLGPAYEWNSQQGGKFTLGISFMLPLANNNEGPIAEANAKRLLAAKHFEVVQAAVINQIELAEAAFTAAEREAQSTQRIVALQAAKQRRLRSAITQSEAAALPLLYAMNDVQIAEVAGLAAYAKLIRAKTALEDAIRQPLFGPVVDIGREPI